MLKSFRFRAYPNREQVEAMEEQLETHRRLYNDSLSDRKHCFETEGRNLGYFEQTGLLKTIRASNTYLGRANHSSCQCTLKRLDHAFTAFFRRVKAGETPGYPRFKGRGQFESVEFQADNGARLTPKGRAYFQNVGEIKLKQHRSIEGTVKKITFRRQDEKWFVVFTCDLGEINPEPSTNPSVGIDLGLKAFLATSDAEMVAPPKFYRKAQAKLRTANRSLCRKKKGSVNRRKARIRLARHHQHIANQRSDFHHKTAHDLVKRFGTIAHEDLNIIGIARSPLAKSTHDAGWGEFLTILAYKAENAGVRTVAVDPRLTTQTCSQCGGLPAVPLTLSDRRYECAHCGLSLDRDVNSARNILRRAGTRPLGANVADQCERSPRSLRL